MVLLATRALPGHTGTRRRLDFLSVALNAWSFAALVGGAELLLTKTILATVLIGSSLYGFNLAVGDRSPHLR